MTEKQEPFNSVLVTLSQDEVAFILQATGYKQLPGFNIPEDFGATHAKIVGRTLLARGVATVDDEENYVIDETIASLVACGSVAARILTVAYQSQMGEAEQHWFYSIPNLHVYHVPVNYGIHFFQSLNGETLAILLLKIMRLETQDINEEDGHVYIVPADIHLEAKQLAQQGEQVAGRQLLTRQDLPDSLAVAIVEPANQAVISMVSVDDDGVEKSSSIVILQNASDNWLLSPDEDFLEARRVTIPDILDAVGSMWRA